MHAHTTTTKNHTKPPVVHIRATQTKERKKERSIWKMVLEENTRTVQVKKKNEMKTKLPQYFQQYITINMALYF